MGVMKIGNIVPRGGIKPTSLAFWASVLPLCHVGSLMSLYPHLPVYADPCLKGQCSRLNSSPWNSKSFNTYIYTGSGLTYTYPGQVQQPYCGQLVQDPGHGTSVMGVMKMGNMVLERFSNPHLWNSGPVCYYYIIQASCCHHCNHDNLPMQLLTSAVNADDYIIKM